MTMFELSDVTLELQTAMHEARARLGNQRLVLAIHQASFPAAADDLAHGAPASLRGREFLHFVARLGFDGVLFGPGGITSPSNPSPYDATLLSRNPLALTFAPLTEARWGHVLDAALLAELSAGHARADRADHSFAHAAVRRILEVCQARAQAIPDLRARRAQLRAENAWLFHEARFEAIAAAVGHDDWRRWPSAPPEDARAAERFELGQLLAAEQHAELRLYARSLGLELYADAQVGISHRDRFAREHIFLPGYAMGAPPSRTNPAGQPWGYAVLDPRQLAPGGAGRAFVTQRLEALLAHHDGLRIDHPHGWVCPWVYRDPSDDPPAAVRAGARLHESPDLPEHPELAPLARVRPEQLDRTRARHQDDWVHTLDPEQVDAYSIMFDLIVEHARAHGMGPHDLLVEVLSTCPRPLCEVLARHGLGRFRVTQKARVEDESDVYRGDRAAAADWIMVGNHDTAPLKRVITQWLGTAEAERRARYLAERLEPEASARATLSERWSRDPAALAQAMLAELFLGPAQHAIVFWVDLFGLVEIYNRPGEISVENWTLRVPRDFEAAFAAARARGDAPSLPRALAWALHARGLDRDEVGRALVARLDQS
jgi:4-alpha-glucanotransferase